MTSDPKMLPSVYFVRYGQTEWSLSGRHTGSTNIALTDHDEDKARALIPSLKRTGTTS